MTTEADHAVVREVTFTSDGLHYPFHVARGLWCEPDGETVIVHLAVDHGEELKRISCGRSVLFGPYRISVEAF